MKANLASLLIFALASTALVACMNLGTGTSPTTRYYLLDPKATPKATTLPRERPVDLTLGIGPVVIPPYLDRPQIVTRVSNQEVVADDFNHWAEPLPAAIARTMGENISRLIGGTPIRIHPWSRSRRIDIQIAIDVYRFDTGPSGAVVWNGVWRIVDPTDDRLLVERQSFIERVSSGPAIADRVEAMSLCLADLSREIFDALEKLPQLSRNRTHSAIASQ